MKMLNLFFALSICSAGLLSCDDHYDRPDKNIGVNDAVSALYVELYEPISNKGQYTFPEMTVAPKKFWTCVEVLGVGSRNDVGQTEQVRGLQYHLLCQSMAGLTNRAVQQGRSEVGFWMHDHEGRNSYKDGRQALIDMGAAEIGMQSGLELAKNNYGIQDGINIQIRDLFDGYILTDISNNPESAIVASVASHVYNSIIIDVRDKANFESAGYAMTYDASKKSTADAWREFKDKCSNKGLVVMPVQSGELRDFAIMNGFFVININKKQNTSAQGQNLAIYEEILGWLEPGAPIFGWEQGVDEALFVNRSSETGHPWIPSDWSYNLPLMSLKYTSRQTTTLAKVQNPSDIDFTQKANYISYYLSDGDNVQWMLNGFTKDFYENPDAVATKMGFGFPSNSLSMLAPIQFNNIINQQRSETTLIEALAGGYLYVDNFASKSGKRAELLKKQADAVAATMRQHRIKVLGTIAQDIDSEAAIEGYQAFVDANDQLEGIVAIQYSPYAGGEGSILWVKNKKGYQIPVITARYSLWNFGNRNTPREGTPAYVANKLKSEANEQTFSLISVHAWSNFKNIGTSNDELAENTDGNKNGASAAVLCNQHLASGNNFKTVSVQELIWRVRMNYQPEETKKYLSEVF